MNFVEELKRRNVFRVGIAYGVAAWVILQVVDLVLDNTDTPDWVMQVFMLVAVLGFVISLIIAWAYELTPEGIKREADVVRDESVTHQTARKLDYITLAALVVVVGLFAVDRMFPKNPPASTPLASEASDNQKPVAVTGTESEASATPELGVAVLPFENLSEDPANAFFAGGVHEDVLTHLSRISELRVISRTSMVKVAERGLDVRQIGESLGVTHVLEGSVRRAGDQVRVTVQLIDAKTDEHLWADNFDRKLDDIFAIQSEIAQSIAQQLETEISPTETQRIEQVPTTNLQAYDAYLKARELSRVWLGGAEFEQMRDLLELAVELDPQFLDAQLLLNNSYGRLVWVGSDPEGVYRKKAGDLTEHIESTWQGSPEAIVASAQYAYTVERDYEKALRLFNAALPQLPNNADILLNISSCHKRLEQYEQGLTAIDRALEIDPEQAVMQVERVFHLMGLGRNDDAISQINLTIERFPTDTSAKSTRATIGLSTSGDVDTFLSLGKEIQALEAWSTQQYRRFLLQRDGLESAISALNLEDGPVDSWPMIGQNVFLAELYNLDGREEESTAAARQALQAAEAILASGQPLPGNTPKQDYANFAYMACLANEPGKFNQYRAVARSIKAAEIGTERLSKQTLGVANAECGNTQTGWDQVSTALMGTFLLSEYSLVLDPLYAHYFSELPEYQAMAVELGISVP